MAPKGNPPRPHEATFRFYAELNDFLAPGQDGRALSYRFRGRPAVKDAIEAQGVPHPEVDLILANGASVGFAYPLRDGDRIAVYPVFEALDIAPLVRLRERPLREPRFALDVHLGRLARWLRLLGFDTVYRNDFEDRELVNLAVREHRILLTRDRRLLHHKEIDHGYCVRADNPDAQVGEILRRFQLENSVQPFARCGHCNGLLQRVSKEAVEERLEPKTKRYYEVFHQCDTCGRVYWEGSHFARLAKRLEGFVRSA